MMKTQADTSNIKQQKRSRKRLWLSMLLFLLLACLVGFAAIQWINSTSLEHAQESIERRHPIITAIHVLIIASVALFWEPMVRFFARLKGAGKEATQVWIAWRWRAIGWLVLYELIFVQDGLSIIFTAFK
jgi:H+/Cl- antiporter ClcA